MKEGARPRPVNDAATRQIWYSVLAAVAPGLIYLAAVLQSGRPVTSNDLVAAGLAILVPLAGVETARRRTVAQAEDEVTPKRSPRDDQGRPLRPRDADLQELLDLAVAELADRRGAAQPTPAPTGTRAYLAVGGAKSMQADSAFAAADGPPSKQPHYDYAGDQVRDYDEDRARERGADPQVAWGREVANRRDRVTAGAVDSGAPRHRDRRG